MSHNASKCASLLRNQESGRPGRLPARVYPTPYYGTGEARSVLESSPHLEAFTDRGYEVLFLTDPVNEIVVQSIRTLEEKPLRSVAKGDLDLGSEEERKQAKEEMGKELGDVLRALQKHLDEHAKEVRLSARPKSSPAWSAPSST